MFNEYIQGIIDKKVEHDKYDVIITQIGRRGMVFRVKTIELIPLTEQLEKTIMFDKFCNENEIPIENKNKNKGAKIMSYLNEKEEQKSNEFRSKHCGTIHYELHPTGIATKIIIVCEGCGKKEDISDHDSW